MTPSPTLQLLVTEPDDTPGEPPATFTLRGESALIGRDPHCDLLVADPSASLRHGLFSPTPQGYRYTDLSSTNGTRLLRADGTTEPCPPGLGLPLSPGDTLLIGAADRPIRVALAAPAPAPLRPATPPSPLSATRTIVARAPLVELAATPPSATATSSATALAALASFAARALTAASPAALATLVTEALAHYAPNAATHGVALWGPAIAATAGAPLPAGLRELALSGRLDAAELAVEGSALPLPQTQSLAETGTSAALIVPISTPGATTPTTAVSAGVAAGVTWGVAFATSPLGAAAFPAGVTEAFAVLGPLFALAASTLSRAALAAHATASTPPPRPDPAAPLGVSPTFTEAVALARQVAATEVPVLIRGETGSGKEVLARYLHAQSRRRDRPFVAFNCAAIPENLIESELFGHVRGAFTSATSDRRGLFEEAHGGTLFLDEVGEMPLAMQAKLLRVLQDGEVRRVGQNRPTRVDVRVVSATHRDLAALAAENRFRSDLMYRLNAVTLTLPPLRDRPEDIPLLAHAFLARASQRSHRSFPGFSPDALWALSLHPFPGNVRELDNEIQRAAALTPDGEPISARAFSPTLRDRAPRHASPAAPTTAGASPEPPLTSLREAVSQAERAAIERALAAAQGNVSEAARLLEVTRAGLYKAMERLGLK